MTPHTYRLLDRLSEKLCALAENAKSRGNRELAAALDAVSDAIDAALEELQPLDDE